MEFTDFGNIFSRVKEAEKSMKQCELEYDFIRDNVTRAYLGEAKAVYTQELIVEYEFWPQKFAIKWIQIGDANTKFFHSRVRQRSNFNFIFRIKNEDGVWLDQLEKVKESVVEFDDLDLWLLIYTK